MIAYKTSGGAQTSQVINQTSNDIIIKQNNTNSTLSKDQSLQVNQDIYISDINPTKFNGIVTYIENDTTFTIRVHFLPADSYTDIYGYLYHYIDIESGTGGRDTPHFINNSIIILEALNNNKINNIKIYNYDNKISGATIIDKKSDNSIIRIFANGGSQIALW